jgi:hypothetical protein
MIEQRAGFYPHSYYHVGLVVADLEVAMAQLGPALGLTFNEPHTSVYGGETIHVTYARQGPPYYELIQGSAGGRWNTEHGSKMDHVGYFSTDLDADVATLEAAGLPVDIDGREYGSFFTYHRSSSTGMRVELIAGDRYDGLMEMIQS